MKATILTIVLCFALGWVGDCAAQPFAGQTRNKLVVKQSKRAIKRAAKGKTYYTHKNGKVKRNWWGR